MPRRDRETSKEERAKQQVGRVPQNKAKVGTPRRAKSASNKDSDVAVVVATNTVAVEYNNPLKKVVFINHVLRFLKQGYVDSDDKKTTITSIPKFIELRHVSSSWKETVEFYNPQPQETALTFCRRFLMSSRGDLKVPSVQGSIVLRDIFASLCSNVEITNVPGKSDDDDDDVSSYLLPGISWFFRRCLESSAWKKQPAGFEHHAALVRDSLCWSAKFWVFKREDYEDDVEDFCETVDLVIKMKKGECFGFDTPEVRDALLSASKTITESDDTSRYGGRYRAVEKWFDLVKDLTGGNEKAQKSFGTKEVYDEFIRLSDDDELGLFEGCDFEYGDIGEIGARACFYLSMFDAISAITELKQNGNLFATVELRDKIAELFRYADAWWCNETSSDRLSKLLHNLISTSKSNKKLFAVEGIRDVMLRNYRMREFSYERWEMLRSKDYFNFRHRRFTKNITNNESACLFFENLVALVEVKPKLFLIDVTRKNFVEFARRIVADKFRFVDWKTAVSVSSETIRSFLTALQTMLNHNEKLFFSKRIDDFLIKLKTEKKLLRGSTPLFSEIEKKYEKMKKQLEKEKQEKEEEEEEERREWGDDEEEEEEKKKEKKKRNKKQKDEEDLAEWYEFIMYDGLDDDYWKDSRYAHSFSYWREELEEKLSQDPRCDWCDDDDY